MYFAALNGQRPTTRIPHGTRPWRCGCSGWHKIGCGLGIRNSLPAALNTGRAPSRGAVVRGADTLGALRATASVSPARIHWDFGQCVRVCRGNVRAGVSSVDIAFAIVSVSVAL